MVMCGFVVLGFVVVLFCFLKINLGTGNKMNDKQYSSTHTDYSEYKGDPPSSQPYMI